MNRMLDIKHRIKLVFLTPVKLIHIIANKLYRSQLAETLFIILGIGATILLLFKWLWPFQTGGKVVIAMIYGMFILTFEIMLLIKVWKNICNYICNITEIGNLKYNTCRDNIRRRSGNSSAGIDEDAKIGIEYFIKKNKKEKEFRYIHN